MRLLTLLVYLMFLSSVFKNKKCNVTLQLYPFKAGIRARLKIGVVRPGALGVCVVLLVRVELVVTFCEHIDPFLVSVFTHNDYMCVV